jgi:hypothetical protein
VVGATAVQQARWASGGSFLFGFQKLANAPTSTIPINRDDFIEAGESPTYRKQNCSSL